jgi:hypothetical protein
MTNSVFNENFFENDNPRNFYWAGFLAPDGCLRDYNQKTKYTSKKIWINQNLYHTHQKDTVLNYRKIYDRNIFIRFKLYWFKN